MLYFNNDALLESRCILVTMHYCNHVLCKADKLNSCKRLDLVINKHALYILQLINVLCSQDQNVRQSLQREEIKYIHYML